ncbi:hypothetical protein [Stenotrophomonas maltophilia]|uniref:hypothetical protein n=1 Tax=Stenotrophomonas maltophilia TaxID=40324 RepID=UPI0013D8EF22|nr:hypothetical protein [Stenotrophomonas maltophilia]
MPQQQRQRTAACQRLAHRNLQQARHALRCGFDLPLRAHSQHQIEGREDARAYAGTARSRLFRSTRFDQGLVDTLDLLERVVLGVVRQRLRVVLQRRQRALPLLHIQHVGKRGRFQIREQPHCCQSGRSLAVVIQHSITG